MFFENIPVELYFQYMTGEMQGCFSGHSVRLLIASSAALRGASKMSLEIVDICWANFIKFLETNGLKLSPGIVPNAHWNKLESKQKSLLINWISETPSSFITQLTRCQGLQLIVNKEKLEIYGYSEKVADSRHPRNKATYPLSLHAIHDCTRRINDKLIHSCGKVVKVYNLSNENIWNITFITRDEKALFTPRKQPIIKDEYLFAVVERPNKAILYCYHSEGHAPSRSFRQLEMPFNNILAIHSNRRDCLFLYKAQDGKFCLRALAFEFFPTKDENLPEPIWRDLEVKMLCPWLVSMDEDFLVCSIRNQKSLELKKLELKEGDLKLTPIDLVDDEKLMFSNISALHYHQGKLFIIGGKGDPDVRYLVPINLVTRRAEGSYLLDELKLLRTDEYLQIVSSKPGLVHVLCPKQTGTELLTMDYTANRKDMKVSQMR